MRVVVTTFLVTILVAACASDPADDPAWGADRQSLTIAAANGATRIAFVGDVILGRSVAPIVDKDPDGIFAGVRHVISQADLALFNLESPLTYRDHETSNPHHFEADPAGADLLAAAGFDIAGLANNHSGDAGLWGIVDTLDALGAAQIRSVGVGRDTKQAFSPLVVDAGSARIAILAFDLTWQGPAAADGDPGLAEWDAELIQEAVGNAQELADVVVVGLHGGIEYRATGADPMMDPAIALLADLGVDVVWGHGPHVVRPVRVAESAGERAMVVAQSLGNFLFDQRSGAGAAGAVLEVLVDVDGVVAFRTGRTDHSDLRVTFEGWDPPAGDAVAIAGQWWELVRQVEPLPHEAAPTAGFPYGDVFAASIGDLTGDEVEDIVVSYRYPFRTTLANEGREDIYADAAGRAAHFGIFEPVTWRKIWAAGTLQQPAETLLSCEQVLGFGYSALDSPGIVATGAAIWIDFGFSYLPELGGAGELDCRDVDGDESPDLIVRR